MKKAIFRTLGLAIVAGGGWYGYHYYKQMPARQEQIPTAKVQRGDVVIRAYSRGELRAARTVTVIAPNLFGTVQVTDLAPVGSLAKEKDLLVEYDDSERQSALEEARLSVQSDDEQLKKAKADLAITQSQDAVTLLKTRYNVRRAELDVQRNPIIAEIDGKKNVLTLEQQKRALLQLETDIEARQEQADSQLGGAAGASQPQPDRCAARIAAHRLVQDPGADHRPGGRQTEPRRQCSTSARKCRTFARATPCSPACRWRTFWIFPKWKSGPRWANWIAPI